MDYPDSNQHLKSVDELCIVAAFKYPKYLPLIDQSVFRAMNETLIANASHYVRDYKNTPSQPLGNCN